MTLLLAAGSLAATAVPARSLQAQLPPAGSAPFLHTADAFHRSQYSSRTSAFPRPLLHRDVHTAVPLAGEYFDAGLSLHYAYRHAESVRMFREAQRLDPRCVMCVIGEAIALGPTVDASMDSASEIRAVSAIRRALLMVPYGDNRFAESAWARAVSARYIGRGDATRGSLDSAYATSMRRLADENPGDADAATLAAEALMILSPYQYWTASGAPMPGTRTIVARLDRALQIAPGHIGACNFFVHVMESVQEAPQCGAMRRGVR
jgi:hypothetical protein